MWKRALLALVLALAAGTCQAPAATSIAGTGDVNVMAVRFVPGTDSGGGLAAGGRTVVLVRVKLKNSSAHDFTPDVRRFFLTSAQSERYQATDSGSSVFAGVSNSHRTLKQ